LRIVVRALRFLRAVLEPGAKLREPASWCTLSNSYFKAGRNDLVIAIESGQVGFPGVDE
jgi:hypothetical protein